MEDIFYLDSAMVVDITTMALAQEERGAAVVRDHGLLESAVHRPKGTSFGNDHYPDIFQKAAALMHSLAKNHVFIDGNKRAAWNSTAVFLELNGKPLTDPVEVDRAERFVLDVATGRLDDIEDIAAALRTFHMAH